MNLLVVKFSFPTLAWPGSKPSTKRVLRKARKLIESKGWGQLKYSSRTSLNKHENFCVIGALCFVLSKGKSSCPLCLSEQSYQILQNCLASLASTLKHYGIISNEHEVNNFIAVRDFNDKNNKEKVLGLFYLAEMREWN